MKINYLIILSFFLLNAKTYPQSTSAVELLNEGKSTSYHAYIKYDISLFLKARDIFESAFKLNKTDILPVYHLLWIDEKLLEMSLKKDNESTFEKYYDSSITKARQISTKLGYESEGKTVLAAIYTMKIANDPLSAISLSSEIHELLDDAQKINPMNPISYMIRGIMKYNTPGLFGGSYEEAVQNFSKAISIFSNSKNDDTLQPSWVYLEALAWLGRSLEKTNDLDAAEFIYQKALSIEPDFSWVKNSLLPRVEEKLRDKGE